MVVRARYGAASAPARRNAVRPSAVLSTIVGQYRFDRHVECLVEGIAVIVSFIIVMDVLDLANSDRP